jgi:bifunctional UDP-N-acetylglucosamine pyrophosphorylase/glucosamine-1-phosphate N-acetyltransferase
MSTIDVNCVFEGAVTLGNGVRIGANLRDPRRRHRRPRRDPSVHPHRWRGTRRACGAGSLIGPFARLRPGAVLAEEVHIGNFVEVKNSTLARGAKANHLAYLGDTTVGERVNYGAGQHHRETTTARTSTAP